MKKLSLLLAVFLLAACGGKETLTGAAQTEANEKGEYSLAEVTLEDGKITKIYLDAVKGGKKKAAELGSDYNMKGNSKIGKEFNEQMEFLQDYIVKNGLEAVTLGEDGKATNEDVLTGCTVNLKDIMAAAEAAVEDAKAAK